jgi:hypothetical protein
MKASNKRLERVGIGLLLCVALVTFFTPVVSIYGPFTGTQWISGYEVHSRLIQLQSTLGNGPASGAAQEHRVSSRDVAGGVVVHDAPPAPLSLRMAWLTSLFIFICLGCAAISLVDLFFTRKLTAALGFAGGCFGILAMVDLMVMNSSLRAWLAEFTANDSFGIRSNPFVAMRALMINSVQMTPGPGLYVLTGCLFVSGLLSFTDAIPRAGLVVRRGARVKLAQSVRIRPADSRKPEEICTSVNVSDHGMYFEATATHYYPGMEVFMTRSMADGVEREEHGSVLRVEKLENGKVGVAIHIFSVM